MVLYGVLWCSVVLCGAVWYCVEWCSAVQRGVAILSHTCCVVV